MTVSSQVSSVSYLGDGVTTLLPVPYYFLEQTHLLVTVVNLDSSTSTLVLGTDYSVSGAGNQAGGSITMNAVPAVGIQIIIERSVPATQETDYVANDPFPAESNERALDKLTMLIQQGFSGLSRALRRPVGKSYFDAEGRLISNVADPVSDQDAATKGWSGRYFADLIDGATGLINTTTGILYDAGTLFDHLRFGVNRTVDSIAALRLLSSARNQRAFVLGYYAKADGGGGSYYVDPADTISTDNGGSIIVAADGARWKLSSTTPLSIRQFGGKGDGVTDDTSSAKAWIAAISGGKGFWSAGTWLVQDSLLIPPRTTLQGAGMGSTTILHGGSVPASGFILMASAGNSLLCDLSINGNAGLVGSFTGSEVDLSGSQLRNRLERVRIYNASWIGVSNGALGSISDCTLTGPNSAVTGGTFGVWCDMVIANTEVKNCNITDWRLNGVFQGGHCLIEGNTFGNNHVQVSPVGGGQVASGVNLRSSIITGNLFKEAPGAGSHGIELDNAATLVIGNVFRPMGGYGVILQSTDGHVVTGNQFLGAGLSGIRVNAGLNGFVIADNKVISCPIGIDIAAGASNYYQVTGNTLLGNSVAMNDGGTGIEKVVLGNPGYQRADTVSVTASPFTYTNLTGSPATMLLFGGNVSLVTLSGRTIATGTNIQISIPRKQSVVITYSVAPSAEVVAN